MSKGFNLYIHGKSNTQKTSVATYMAKAAFFKKIPTKYTSMPVLTQVISDFKDNQSNYKYLFKLPLLFIDNAFDETKLYISKNEFLKTSILSLIKYRIDNNLSTIYVSNKSIENINLELFGFDIQDLLIKNTKELEFTDVLPIKVLNKSVNDFFKVRRKVSEGD